LFTRPLRAALVLTVTILAAALALTMSRGAVADALFQSSPLLPTNTPEVFIPEPVLRVDTPAPILPEAPIIEPLLPEAAPGVPGFLPAPTLTNPDDLLSGSALSQGSRPPLSGAAAPVEEAEPTPIPAPAGAAQLIDSAVMLLGYAWLCCGAALLALAVVAFVWLMRRSARRRARI
jgi:hypothetical protein